MKAPLRKSFLKIHTKESDESKSASIIRLFEKAEAYMSKMTRADWSKHFKEMEQVWNETEEQHRIEQNSIKMSYEKYHTPFTL